MRADLVVHEPSVVMRQVPVVVAAVATGVTVLLIVAAVAAAEAPAGDAVVGFVIVLVFLSGLMAGNLVILARPRAVLDSAGVIIRHGPRWLGMCQRVPWSEVTGVEATRWGVRIHTHGLPEMITLRNMYLPTHAQADTVRSWWHRYGTPPPPLPPPPPAPY